MLIIVKKMTAPIIWTSHKQKKTLLRCTVLGKQKRGMQKNVGRKHQSKEWFKTGRDAVIEEADQKETSGTPSVHLDYGTVR